ncbi:MAG: hypothetical protein CMQ46_08835 [Gammaproteobacteria bacterium]|nr:hypothetical protein [Gammaproteobacteria bacterium]MBJ55351.1 hypothetical protein [Gammaproteobacteria bacterium]|tara:strand:- start:670 stop:867 length:198 start_codon:yes stop_codon:yes gene_type:complete
MRELTESEIAMVGGGNIWQFVKNTALGGAVWDGVKFARSWAADTFFASDGSSGSRYPIEDCQECS